MVRCMRFFAAIGVLGLFSAAIAAGIVLTVHGNPWLLLFSLGLFSFLFYRVGCTHS